MECEACGDTISLSSAYRDDDGNFVCQDCYTKAQRKRSAPAPGEEHSNGGSGSPPTQGGETPHANPGGGHGHALDSNQPSERRFNTLLSIGKLISGIGWVFVGLGALAAIIGIIVAISEAGNRYSGGEQAALSLAAGLGGGLWAAVMGILIVAQGQVLSCFVAIERNTRSTYEMMRAENE